MKKLILAVALAATTLVGANAQGFVLGGGLSFEYGKGKNLNGLNTAADGASYGFEIAPVAAYVINDKFLAGAQVGISLGKSEIGGLLNRYGFGEAEAAAANVGSEKFLGWFVTPFVRYSFAKVGNLTFAGQLNLEVNGTKFDDADISTLGFGINIAPVVNYAINDHWSVEGVFGFASIGYNFNKIDGGTPEDPTTHNFGFGLNQGKTVAVAAVYSF